MDTDSNCSNPSRLKDFLARPCSFFYIVSPIPFICSLTYLFFGGTKLEELGWGFPLIALVFSVAAGLLVYRAVRRKEEVVPAGSVLWKLLGMAVVFCALADYHLYETVFTSGIHEMVAVIASCLFLTMGGFCLFHALLRRWSFVVWAPFLLLGLIQAVSFLEYGTVLNSLVLAETLETSWEEALAYLTPVNIVCFAAGLVLVGVLCWAQYRILRGRKRKTLLTTGVLFFALALLLAQPMPVEDEDTDLYWPYAEAYRTYAVFEEALHSNVATIECVKKLPSPAKELSSITTLKGGEGVVLVIHVGESVRADRMGINGYERNTTPWLSSQAGKGLINFPNCISAACDTCQAQIAILTDGRRDIHETSPELVPHVGSVLDLFHANGFDITCFRGARCAEKLKYDLVVHLLTRCASKSYNAPASPWTAVPQMLETLQAHNDGQNLVFFINNEGSHTPFFHYDHDNTPFGPAIDNFEIPSRHAEEVNNAYDSTIHYTDEYVHRVANLLQGRPFVYIYVSDHGEYLGHDGIWGRGGLGSSELSYHDTEGCRVGMFVLYSKEFAELHPHFAEALDTLSKNAGMTVGHEHVFHTLLGLFGVQTPHYNESLDLCSPAAQPYNGPLPGKKKE